MISVTPCACTLTLALDGRNGEVRREGSEKETTREKEKEGARETGKRSGERPREDSIYSAFVPSSSRERESPSTRLDSNSLVTTTGETDRGGKETEPGRVRGKRRDNEGERKKDITREKERARGDRSEATQEGRVYAEEAENSLFERERERDQAATVYKTLYMQVDTEKETRRRGKEGKRERLILQVHRVFDDVHR